MSARSLSRRLPRPGLFGVGRGLAMTEGLLGHFARLLVDILDDDFQEGLHRLVLADNPGSDMVWEKAGVPDSMDN